MPNGVAVNSVTRGENNDGVLGTSFIARSISAEGGRGTAIPGNMRGTCAGILISANLSRNGRGLDAGRLTGALDF